MLLWASKFVTPNIECSFKIDKLTPLGVVFILLLMVHKTHVSCAPIKNTLQVPTD